MRSNRIRETRKAAGMTQEELASKIGVTRATLSRYENGTIDPPSNKLIAISEALGTLVEDILSEDMGSLFHNAVVEGYETGEKDAISYERNRITRNIWKLGYKMSAKEQKLVKIFSSLNDEGKEKVIQYAEDILHRYHVEAPQEDTTSQIRPREE